MSAIPTISLMSTDHTEPASVMMVGASVSIATFAAIGSGPG
jgi:hypothetical protein